MLKNGDSEEASRVIERMYHINTGSASYSAASLPLLEYEFMKYALIQENGDRSKAKPKVNSICEQKSLVDWLNDNLLRRNLIFMGLMWINVQMSYWIMSFEMKYLAGNIYDNLITSSVADIIGTFVSLILYEKFGMKQSFLICLSLSILGGLMMLNWRNSSTWMPLFLFFAKLGSASTFNLCFISNTDIFPTLFTTTALGICDFSAKILSIGAPQIAERNEPIPTVMFVFINAIAVAYVFQIKTK